MDTKALNGLYEALTENIGEDGTLIWDHTWEAFEDEVVRLLGEEWRYSNHSDGCDIWEWTDEVFMALEGDE